MNNAIYNLDIHKVKIILSSNRSVTICSRSNVHQIKNSVSNYMHSTNKYTI